ncbi:MAG: PAS domain S-box protein [Elainellaceae cyanobacterium]
MAPDSEAHLTREQLYEQLHELRQSVAQLKNTNHQLKLTQKTLNEFEGGVDNALVGFFQITSAGDYLYANPALARMLGYEDVNDLLDGNSARYPLFDDPDDYQRFTHGIACDGLVKEFEHCVQGRDGSAVWLMLYARAVQGELGEITTYEGHCIDISARKHAEVDSDEHKRNLEQQIEERTAALRESNDYLIEEIAERQRALHALRENEAQKQAMLAAIPDLMTVVSRDGVYLDKVCSEAFFDRVDESIDVIGQHIGDVLPEHIARRQLQAVQEVLSTGVGQIFEQTLLIGDRTQYEEVRVFPCKPDAALIILRDITARKDSQNQFRAILETIPGIVSWIGSDMRYRGVNLQLAHMFGLEPKDFVGQDIGFLKASHEFAEFIREFFGQARTEAYREFTANVNGQQRTYLMVVQKYSDSQAAFAVGVDITERRNAEDELRSTKAQLEAALDAVPGIVSWISADLRYLGVNRHLADLFNLPPSAFVNQDIGFLQTGQDFSGFVQSVLDSPETYASREIDANINGALRNFLIMAQKYSQSGSQAVFTVGIDITERRQAELALEQAETNYRSIFERVAEGIFQTNPQGQYLSANPALARIYGYGSVDELMSNLTSIQNQLYVVPNRRQEFIDVLESQGEIFKFESQVYRKDGQLIWISENARVVKDEFGQSLYYEGTVEDITERKRAVAELERAKIDLESKVVERTRTLQDLNQRLFEEISERQRIEKALRSSEAELRALFAGMTDYIAVFDAGGCYRKIVSTNSTLLYGPELERVGKSVYDVLPRQQAALFIIYIQRALNTGRTLTLEYSLPVGDTTEEAWFTASVSPMPDNCVIWVARDITQQKRAESALRQAEEKYRSIFENAAEGIFQTTPQGSYLSVNPALVNMYGYSSAEDLMTQVSSVDQLYVDANRREEFVALVEANNMVSNFEATVYRKDGEIIWTAENARAVRDDKGKILYYEGTVQDITVRKLAEIALHEEKGKLHEEQMKSEKLLLNILPRPIAKKLTCREDSQAIAERYEQATILFADLVDFTSVAASISASDIVDLLNNIFSSFDKLADRHGLEKIKTIGDAYMVAGGIPTRTEGHVSAIAEMALDMQREIANFRRCPDSPKSTPFQLRIGIHTGPVVAGVIGIRKFIYDLWGDTVNIASRMESQGEPDAIQVTAEVRDALKDQYCLEERGLVDVKGRGVMKTYWLQGKLQVRAAEGRSLH